jgi:hypothetical protein
MRHKDIAKFLDHRFAAHYSAHSLVCWSSPLQIAPDGESDN